MMEFIPGFTGERQEYTMDWSTAITHFTQTHTKSHIAGSSWELGSWGTSQTGAVRNNLRHSPVKLNHVCNIHIFIQMYTAELLLVF